MEKNSAYYLSSITVTICLVYLFAIIYSLIRYRKRLNEPEVMAKMSYLTENLNFKNHGNIVLSYPVAFCMRIFLLCGTVVGMQSSLIVQFSIINVANIALLNVLSLKPFVFPHSFRFEMLGEMTILIVLDCLIIMSNPEVKPEARQNLGWIILSAVLLLIVITQVFVVITNFRSIKMWCRKRSYKKKIA